MKRYRASAQIVLHACVEFEDDEVQELRDQIESHVADRLKLAPEQTVDLDMIVTSCEELK